MKILIATIVTIILLVTGLYLFQTTSHEYLEYWSIRTRPYLEIEIWNAFKFVAWSGTTWIWSLLDCNRWSFLSPLSFAILLTRRMPSAHRRLFGFLGFARTCRSVWQVSRNDVNSEARSTGLRNKMYFGARTCHATCAFIRNNIFPDPMNWTGTVLRTASWSRRFGCWLRIESEVSRSYSNRLDGDAVTWFSNVWKSMFAVSWPNDKCTSFEAWIFEWSAINAKLDMAFNFVVNAEKLENPTLISSPRLLETTRRSRFLSSDARMQSSTTVKGWISLLLDSDFTKCDMNPWSL